MRNNSVPAGLRQLHLPWTEADSDAYWLAVARERISDERKAMGCADPHKFTLRAGDDALHPASFAEPDPELQRVWQACLAWLPPVDRQTLDLGYASGSGGLPIGRAGGGMHIARELGIHQTTWVHRMHIAEARLTVLAPLCRAGHSIQAVCRRVDATPLHRASSVPHSALVRAYAATWSTLGAGKVLGLAQAAVHKRVTKMAESEPILQAIHSTRKLK